MRYEQKSFSVGGPSNPKYASEYERIFARRDEPEPESQVEVDPYGHGKWRVTANGLEWYDEEAGWLTVTLTVDPNPLPALQLTGKRARVWAALFDRRGVE